MKIKQEESKDKENLTIFLKDEGGSSVTNGHLLLISSNDTYFEVHTNSKGVAIFKNLPDKVYSLYIAHTLYPAYVVDNCNSEKTLTITISKKNNEGSIICTNGTGYIPGLNGRLNPIFDTSNRTYLYADNVSIDNDKRQPATFEVGKPLILEDRFGVRAIINFIRIKGRSSLIQYKIIPPNKNIKSDKQLSSSLSLESGRDINDSLEAIATKDQFTTLEQKNNISSKIIWYFIVPIIVLVVGYIITEGRLPQIFNKGNMPVEQPKTNLPSEQDNISYRDNLRPLLPLETGKTIGELPSETYFYSDALSIVYELEDPKIDFLKATNNYRENYTFEIQKTASRYYLVGFIADETYSKVGSLTSGSSIFTMLFPSFWGGATHAVAIPFDGIYTIKERTIDLDAEKTVRILDIGFNEINDRPDVHAK